jgi:uracil-DNA glycosylase
MASNSPATLLLELTGSLCVYVETLKASGVNGLPRPESEVWSRKSTSPKAQSPEPEFQVPSSKPQALTTNVRSPMVAQAGDLFLSPVVQSVQTLEELRAEIGDCQRCKLCEGRTNIVFGVGNPKAELVFVGEGPGRDEDLRGEPFVGRAGQLLTEIITKGMKMRRDEVYIANVVKCRPPQNRNPEPDEIAACEPFLIKQLELIQPRVIVALGTFAAQTLLKSKTPISRMRGVWHSYRGMKVMPTLHPAYLLRNPNDKRLVWQDIQAVLREVGRL